MTGGTDRFEQFSHKAHDVADKIGSTLVSGFHVLALFAIGATIVWAAVLAFFDMVARGHASVEDILLLFIYLELGAMVGIYFTTNHMPVRFLIYVALTALTRLLMALDRHANRGMANLEHIDLEKAITEPHYGLIVVTAGILVLSIAVLILRYASYSYPSVRRSSASGATAGSDDMAYCGDVPGSVENRGGFSNAFSLAAPRRSGYKHATYNARGFRRRGIIHDRRSGVRLIRRTTARGGQGQNSLSAG